MPRISFETRRQRIRQEIAELRPGGQRRYPERLRRRITAYARLRLDGGANVNRICAEIGVSQPTLSRLLNATPPPLRRVRVVGAADAIEKAVVPRVRGPNGIVVEGLGVEGVAELIRYLS